MRFLLPLLSLVSMNQTPVHDNSVTIPLDAPKVYHKGHRDQVVVKAYKTALSKVTNDKIVFEGGVIDPNFDWSASYLHQRAELRLAQINLGECRGQDHHVEYVPKKNKLGMMMMTKITVSPAGAKTLACMQAVDHVVFNRASQDLDARYGHGVWGVLNKYAAFSCLRRSDNSYKILMAATKGKLSPSAPDGEAWVMALAQAHDSMHRWSPDPTHGATHYFAKYVSPVWKNDRGMIKVATIGAHIFYKKDA